MAAARTARIARDARRCPPRRDLGSVPRRARRSKRVSRSFRASRATSERLDRRALSPAGRLPRTARRRAARRCDDPSARERRGRVDRSSLSAPTPPARPRRSRSRRSRAPVELFATVGLHPHDASDGPRSRSRTWRDQVIRDWWQSASADSTTTTSTRPVRASAKPSRARSLWPTNSIWPSWSTPATPSTTSSTILAQRGCAGAYGDSLLHGHAR